MKKVILLTAMVMSASAFAKGSDREWTCRISGTKANGQVVHWEEGGLPGGLGTAFMFAVRSCHQKGLKNCTANCN